MIGSLIVAGRTDSQAVSAILVATLGYIAVAKGFFIIAFPKWTFAMAEEFARSKAFSKVFPYVALAMSV